MILVCLSADTPDLVERIAIACPDVVIVTEMPEDRPPEPPVFDLKDLENPPVADGLVGRPVRIMPVICDCVHFGAPYKPTGKKVQANPPDP